MEASPIPTRTILPQIREELVWEKRYEGMSIPELKAALLDLHQELNQRKERAAKAQGESSALVFDRVEDCYAGATGPRIVVPRIQPETLQPQFVVLQEHHHPELYRLKRELRWVVRQRTQLARDVQASRPPRPIRRADMLASKRSRPEPRGTD